MISEGLQFVLVGMGIGGIIGALVMISTCYLIPRYQIPKEVRKSVREKKGELQFVGLYHQAIESKHQPKRGLRVIRNKE
jgi:hypothetical protein